VASGRNNHFIIFGTILSFTLQLGIVISVNFKFLAKIDDLHKNGKNYNIKNNCFVEILKVLP